MRSIKPNRIDGSVRAPPSKSMMQRALACALLAKGKSFIKNISLCDDCLTAIKIVEDLGAEVFRKKHGLIVRGLNATAGNMLSNKILDCRESGLCMRMFSAIAALFEAEITLKASNSLILRPMCMIEKPLKSLGSMCKTEHGHAPVSIMGPMKGGSIEADGSISSQFLSGLLIALPLCKQDSEIKVNDLHSKAYVTMTLEVMKHFGVTVDSDRSLSKFTIKGNQSYTGEEFTVEGDWSSAAFMLTAGAIAGRTEVTGLNIHSKQPDIAIVNALENAGADVNIKHNSVKVSKNTLKGFVFDVGECPDLFPALTVLACSSTGTTVIKGIKRLKYKESSRAKVLREELKRIGGHIKLRNDEAIIRGSKLKGGRVHAHNDHRIAMALAIAALNSEEIIELKQAECVSKSYVNFFDDLNRLGVLNE